MRLFKTPQNSLFSRTVQGSYRTSRRAHQAGNKHALLLAAFLSGLTACHQGRLMASDPKITGGRDVGALSSLPTRRSTLALTQPDLLANGRSFCSAVLIGPKTALTAAHCVTNNVGEPLSPSSMLVGSGTILGDHPERSIPVIATAVHRRYRPGALELGDWTDFNDLALLQLANTPATAIPIQLLDSETPLKKGERLTLAGYGVTHSRSDDDTGILRSVLVRVAALEDDIHVFMTEGARRPGIALEPYGRDGRYMRHPVHAGACAGDSGGPAYRKRQDGKTWEVVGITSFGAEMERVGGLPGEHYCTGSNGYTNLKPYVGSIKAAVDLLNEANPCPGATFEFAEEGLKSLSQGSCPNQREDESIK